jgi:hypothetical protein
VSDTHQYAVPIAPWGPVKISTEIEEANAYVPEAGVEDEATEKQHGKPKFLGASKSQLGFFKSINRPKPPPKPTKEPADSCVDREVNETGIFAAASETHTA